MKKIGAIIGRSAGLMFLLNLLLQLPFFGSAPGSLQAHDFNDAALLSGDGPRETRLAQADDNGEINDEIEEMDSDCEDSDCEDSDCEDSDCEDSDCENGDCDDSDGE